MSSSIFSQQPLLIRKTISALLIALILMLLDSKNPDWFNPVRNLTHAAMQPIYQFSAFPTFVSSWSSGTLVNKEALRRENIKLRTRLMHAQAKLQQQDYILAQNARLQGILSTTKPDQFDLTLAQVIGTDTNPLKQIVVINKGRDDGVLVGQTAIDEHGIVGQIVNVYPNTSRLLLISDDQQSVAVTVKRTGQRAIVSGQGSPDALSLDHIFKNSDIRVGDELVSSGLGGRIPAGYRVGRVMRINNEQTDNYVDIEVKPAANFIDNSFVLILQDKETPVEYAPRDFYSSDNVTDTKNTFNQSLNTSLIDRTNNTGLNSSGSDNMNAAPMSGTTSAQVTPPQVNPQGSNDNLTTNDDANNDANDDANAHSESNN